MGFVACNTQVIGLLREALVAQARAALGRLPAAERGTSVVLVNLSRLLMELGKLEEARPLLEETLQARREALGDRDPGTLDSVNYMGDLLEKQGKFTEAIPLFTEELEGLVLLRGMEFQETRESAENLVKQLRNSGQHDEAEALAAEHGV